MYVEVIKRYFNNGNGKKKNIFDLRIPQWSKIFVENLLYAVSSDPNCDDKRRKYHPPMIS